MGLPAHLADGIDFRMKESPPKRASADYFEGVLPVSKAFHSSAASSGSSSPVAISQRYAPCLVIGFTGTPNR